MFERIKTNCAVFNHVSCCLVIKLSSIDLPFFFNKQNAFTIKHKMETHYHHVHKTKGAGGRFSAGLELQETRDPMLFISRKDCIVPAVLSLFHNKKVKMDETERK